MRFFSKSNMRTQLPKQNVSRSLILNKYHKSILGGFLSILIALIGLGLGLSLVQQKTIFNSKAAGLVAYVAPGYTTIDTSRFPSGGSIYATLKIGTLTTNSINVQQDEGYYIRLVSDGVPVTNKPIQFSVDKINWADFINRQVSTSVIYTDPNGYILVDFADWTKLKTGTYKTYFRVKGTTLASNLVAVNVTPVNMDKYFTFKKPGNNYHYSGCGLPYSIVKDGSVCTSEIASIKQDNFNGVCNNPNEKYWTKIFIEEPQSYSVTYNNKTASIKTIPLRFNYSLNTNVCHMGSYTDFTWFPSSGFDYFNGMYKGWALRTSFYDRFPYLTLQRTRKVNAFFIPNEPSVYPGYFVVDKQQDIYPNIDKYNSFETISTTNSKIYQGTLDPYITDSQGTVGWKTDYQIVKVNFPKYKGRTLRIRFLEYDNDVNGLDGVIKNANDAVGWNFDEWFFAERFGIVGINNKIGRGLPCGSDPDCNFSTKTIQQPDFSVSIANYLNVSNLPLVAKVRAMGSSVWSTSISIPAGNSYEVLLTDKNGNKYSGFIEVLGKIYLANGTTSIINRNYWKDLNNNPVTVGNEGTFTAPTLLNQGKGKYEVSIRPIIHSDIKDPLLQLAENNLPWSNLISVTLY